MAEEGEVLGVVEHRLRDLLSGDSQVDVQQLMRCVEPAFERMLDLASDNKRLSAMQHFVISDLRSAQARDEELRNQLLHQQRIPKRDVGIQEPEPNDGSSEGSDSDNDDVRPTSRVTRPAARSPVKASLDFPTGITDAAKIHFDPLARPIATPWRQKRGRKHLLKSSKKSSSGREARTSAIDLPDP